MEVSPLRPSGRQLIEAYGEGRFRISGIVHQGSVLVFPDRTLRWPVDSIADLSPEDLADRFAPLLAACEDPGAPGPELLLIGCGARVVPIPPEVAGRLRAAGIAIEAMDTGAACRTYNVVLAEDRLVAAALVAV